MTTIPHSRSADFPQGVYAHQINDEVHFGFVGGWTKQKKTVERDWLLGTVHHNFSGSKRHSYYMKNMISGCLHTVWFILFDTRYRISNCCVLQQELFAKLIGWKII